MSTTAAKLCSFHLQWVKIICCQHGMSVGSRYFHTDFIASQRNGLRYGKSILKTVGTTTQSTFRKPRLTAQKFLSKPGRQLRVILRTPLNRDIIKEGWIIRFFAENNYLAWHRNTLNLTLVLAFAYMHQHVPMSEVTKLSLFLMTTVNILYGSAVYFYRIRMIRKLMHFKLSTALSYWCGGTVGLLLWVYMLAFFLEYVDNPFALFKIDSLMDGSSPGREEPD